MESKSKYFERYYKSNIKRVLVVYDQYDNSIIDIDTETKKVKNINDTLLGGAAIDQKMISYDFIYDIDEVETLKDLICEVIKRC